MCFLTIPLNTDGFATRKEAVKSSVAVDNTCYEVLTLFRPIIDPPEPALVARLEGVEYI